jgi:hypothetical protein
MRWIVLGTLLPRPIRGSMNLSLLHAGPGTVLYYRTCTVCILYYETTPERMMNQMILKWIQSQQFPSLTRSLVYNNLCLAKSSEVELGPPERIPAPYCTLLCSFSLEAYIIISFFTFIFHKESAHSSQCLSMSDKNNASYSVTRASHFMIPYK